MHKKFLSLITNFALPIQNHTIMPKLFFFLATILLLLLVLANQCGPAYGNAAANYQEYCSGCHGEQLKSFVDRQWIYGSSKDALIKAIKIGYPDDGMPGYDTTFTDDEIADLADYILVGIKEVKAEKEAKFSDTFQSEKLTYRLETVVEGLDVPWGIDFLPNNEMLITERDGAFYRFDNTGKLIKIEGAPKVLARGQGGLLDVRLHPAFEDNNLIYLSYSKPGNEGATTAIMQAQLVGNQLKSQKVIFEASPYVGTRHHYGSRIEFDQDGYLYFSVGDRGRRDRHPQNLDNHCGKIHRLNDDGTIPEDNPFVGQSGAMASIYSYGHRNPQGVAMNPATGEIWTHEHGPKGGDEVNRIEKGKNYGWPVISYGVNYSGTKFTDITEKEGMEQPVIYWVPSIAPSGMAFVEGDRYPIWKGDLLVGSLKFNYIMRCQLEGNEIIHQEKILEDVGRMRDIKIGADGYIYVAVEDPGRIYKIIPIAQ